MNSTTSRSTLAGVLQRMVRGLIFPRHFTGRRAGAPTWPHLERHFLDTPQGPVEYWFIAASQLSRSPRPVVMFAHGNGELIDDWPEALQRYRDLGVHLVLLEYRGYGDSAGTPSERHLVDDFTRLVEQLALREDVNEHAIVYHGRSLGGGVACGAALARAPAALILQSTFTDLHAIARRFGAPRFVLADRFDNAAVMRTLSCPCLIFHGSADTLVPLAHGRALADAGPLGKLCVIPDADHNAPLHLTSVYWEQIASLLSALDP